MNVDKTDHKVYIWRENTQHSQHNIERQDKLGKLTLPDFKTYYKAKAIKTVCYWQNIMQIHIRVE